MSYLKVIPELLRGPQEAGQRLPPGAHTAVIPVPSPVHTSLFCRVSLLGADFFFNQAKSRIIDRNEWKIAGWNNQSKAISSNFYNSNHVIILSEESLEISTEESKSSSCVSLHRTFTHSSWVAGGNLCTWCFTFHSYPGAGSGDLIPATHSQISNQNNLQTAWKYCT